MVTEMIYLDNNATTRTDPRVLEAMIPFLTTEYGNASSQHEFGLALNKKVKEARSNIGSLIGCEENEVIFSSGATESINLAIKGVAENQAIKGRHIVTVVTEHPAVLDTCRYLEKKNFEVTYLPVDSQGMLNLEELKNSLRSDTILVSVMLVNNELGNIQPISKISDIVHNNGSILISDATQAVGKMSINVNDLGIDLMAFSSHKFYGPKGIGALYVRNKKPKIKLDAIIHGGGHERGLRSGTLNVPGIVGMAKASEIANNEMKSDSIRIKKLRDHLERQLLQIFDSSLNGHPTKRLYNVTNICFKDIDADAIIIDLKNVMVSNGSACSSTSSDPSHVLSAIGLSKKDCFSSLRISIGKFNTESDIDIAIKLIAKSVSDLRLINA